jgi:NAD(P)-dependent dehydrogenase (short-subunit alcohol dehydrogenase family)
MGAKDGGVPDVVLVTGAAGAIGCATANAFIDAGFLVVGLDRDPSVTSRESGDGDYHGICVDLEDDDAVAAALATAERAGDLAHVVAIAGGALDEEPPTEHDPVLLDPKVFRASVEANLVSPFVVLRAVMPWLRRSAATNRSVTFTSSWNALTGVGMPAYSAAKAGLIGMTRALTAPLGAEGIRVNVVAPGTIRTPRTERIWEGDEGHFERLAARTATGRLGTPDDVARTFVALAVDLVHVTGQVLVVDGGQTVKRS